MIRILRPLLVILVVVSTLLAGASIVSVDVDSSVACLHSADRGPPDGSREDDSGLTVEESAGEDTESEQDREVHLLATVVLSFWVPEAAARMVSERESSLCRHRDRSSPVRGPPAIS